MVTRRVIQDRQSLGSWVGCLFRQRLRLHGIDARHGKLELVAVPSPQTGRAGARRDRNALDGHTGVATFAQVALGGGEYGGIEPYVLGAPGGPGRGTIRCHVSPRCLLTVA
jgi:hypothetical protein